MKKLTFSILLMFLLIFLIGCNNVETNYPTNCDEFVYGCTGDTMEDIFLYACGSYEGVVLSCDNSKSCQGEQYTSSMDLHSNSLMSDNLIILLCKHTTINPDSCDDSDNGIISNLGGHVEGFENGIFYYWEDECTYYTLFEYYCDGDSPNVEQYHCDYGCNVDKCAEEPTDICNNNGICEQPTETVTNCPNDCTEDTIPTPQCTQDSECVDNNPCTLDKCIMRKCANPDMSCGSGKYCENGECISFNLCELDLDCNDKNSKTIDKCESGQCINTESFVITNTYLIGGSLLAIVLVGSSIFLIRRKKK